MNEEDLYDRMKDVLDSLVTPPEPLNYPSEAVPTGTWVRSTRHDKLGVIVDAFYGDVDKNNKKIIIYTVLLFPKKNFGTSKAKQNQNLYLSNEYEYEIIAYLMMNPIDIKKLSQSLGGLFI